MARRAADYQLHHAISNNSRANAISNSLRKQPLTWNLICICNCIYLDWDSARQNINLEFNKERSTVPGLSRIANLWL